MSKETIEQTLYNGEVVIKLVDNSRGRNYFVAGQKKRPVSVTTATGMVDKSGPLKYWVARITTDYLLDLHNANVRITASHILAAKKMHEVYSEEAKDKGTLVHEWAENYVNGLEPAFPKDPQVLNGVTAFLRWLKDNNVEFVENEKIVYSRKYDYVGKLDAIVRLNGKLSVVDFKTSTGVYEDHYYQVAAYKQAYEEEKGVVLDGPRYVLRFDKETGHFEAKNLDEVPDENALIPEGVGEYQADFMCFLACLELLRRRRVFEKRNKVKALKEEE